MFDQFKSDDIAGFVVFLPMLREDSSEMAEKQAQDLCDSRVAHFWDPDRRTGDLSSETLELKWTAWDIYLVYPPGVMWTGANPPKPSY